MKVALLLIFPLISVTACTNQYADSPERWKIKEPVEQVTPTPEAGNPYAVPENVVTVPKADEES